MICTDVDLANKVLAVAYQRRADDFVGLGIVVYLPPIDLPAVALGGFKQARPALPIMGVSEIGTALAGLSAAASPWHDGFHFVDLKFSALTHVSQYLAPDLTALMRAAPADLPAGARQLTALLVSRYPSAQCVGLLSTQGEVTIYRSGQLHSRSLVQHA
jgi:hypothetical protein